MIFNLALTSHIVFFFSLLLFTYALFCYLAVVEMFYCLRTRFYVLRDLKTFY